MDIYYLALKWGEKRGCGRGDSVTGKIITRKGEFPPNFRHLGWAPPPSWVNGKLTMAAMLNFC